MSKELETKCLTQEFRSSYAHAWEKHTDDFGNEKFSISMLFPMETDLDDVRQKMENCLINTYGPDRKKWGKDAKKAEASIDELLMDGDAERPDDEAYSECLFMTAKSDKKVGVVDENVERIIDPDEFYSGCYARASIRFYIPKKFPRVCCALNNLMKTRDGEPLSGGSKAEDDFAEFAGNDTTQDDGEDWG